MAKTKKPTTRPTPKAATASTSSFPSGTFVAIAVCILGVTVGLTKYNANQTNGPTVAAAPVHHKAEYGCNSAAPNKCRVWQR